MGLFTYANGYCRESTWRELALVKLCLCSVGLMLGLSVPWRQKKPALLASALVFGVTYPLLMTGFIRSVLRQRREGR